jgi:hypothetical protein
LSSQSVRGQGCGWLHTFANARQPALRRACGQRLQRDDGEMLTGTVTKSVSAAGARVKAPPLDLAAAATATRTRAR